MSEIPQDVWERADAIHFAATEAETTIDEVNIIARAIMAERERQWQPIETAPRDGKPILLGHEHAVFSGYWHQRYQGWTDGSCDQFGDFWIAHPTHWIPLPAPPKGE